MPLFKKGDGKFELKLLRAQQHEVEKDIQTIIENNLEVMFNCRFVATEFNTGNKHGGRIDSLALSEENNPVIIEYKKKKDGNLITQALYYLAWIKDHRGDFQMAVDRKFGKKITIDWDQIRVLCIAPDYSKFDLHAVEVMGTEIELWRFKRYEDGSLYIEEIQQRMSVVGDGSAASGKNPVMVAAGKKAAISRANNTYKIEDHMAKSGAGTKDLSKELREFILGLDSAVEEVPKKFYVAYKVAQNFACLDIQKKKILIFLKLEPKGMKLPKGARDVTSIGHFGTGKLEFTLSSKEDLELAKNLIRESYEAIGG